MKKLDPQYDEIPEITCPCGYIGPPGSWDEGVGGTHWGSQYHIDRDVRVVCPKCHTEVEI